MTLNDAQRAAVERTGQDVCVVAGPGSGKTRVLIERFRWLVQAQKIHPRRILTITFTDKAATEIKQRLLEAFAEAEPLRQEMERAWVSTIHGFCTRLLKENAIEAGVDPDFHLLDEAGAEILRHQAAEAALDDLLAMRPDLMPVLLKDLATGASDLEQALLDLYEEARTAGRGAADLRTPAQPVSDCWPEILEIARVALTDPATGTVRQREAHHEFHRWAGRVLALPSDAGRRERLLLLDDLPRPSSLKNTTRARTLAQQLKDSLIPACQAALILLTRLDLYPLCLEALHRIHDEYTHAKRDRGALDFNDLEEFAIRLLESDRALRERIRNSFDHILMDELQDTNRLQWRLLDLIRRPDRLFAVGDVNQSIYFFRHADPAVFHEYRDSVAGRGGVIDELRENYRSRAEILEAVNAMVPSLLDGLEPHRLTALGEHAKKMAPSLEFFHSYAAAGGDDPVRTEACWIARRIREMEATMLIGKAGERRPARFSDFAVLTRTIASLEPIQRALDEFGVPSVISGGRTFFEAREIRDLVAWLAVLANPRDEISLVTVLRSPLVGAPDETLLRLKRAGGEMFAAIAAETGDERLVWFHRLVRQQRAQAGTASPDALLSQALDESAYMDGLPARARANVARLLDLARQRHASAPCTLGELVDDLASWRNASSEQEAAAGELSNCVRLMSVHAAKGLEFPIVFLASLRSGGSNKPPVFCFSPDGTLGALWRHPETGIGVSDPTHMQVWALKKRHDLGEECRLLYVAMTRAEEHLVFTASPNRSLDWASRINDGLNLPSGFPRQEAHTVMHIPAGASIAVTHSRVPPASDFPATVFSDDGVVEYIDPLPTPGQHETVVAVTSVAQFAFCPRQYYLARYLGWENRGQATRSPIPPRTDPGEFSASEFGILVHDLLAGKPRPDATPEALALAERFQSSDLGQRAARATRSGREYDFLIEVEDLVLRGQIDLWFEDGGQIALVDYKSDQVEPGHERQHAVRYEPQLRLYALALERLIGRIPERAVLWYLRTGAAVDVPLGQASLERTRTEVGSLREAQQTMHFPLREGVHCVRCSYYGGACPASLTFSAAAPKSSS